jgi:hypothetical protein
MRGIFFPSLAGYQRKWLRPVLDVATAGRTHWRAQ